MKRYKNEVDNRLWIGLGMLLVVGFFAIQLLSSVRETKLLPTNAFHSTPLIEAVANEDIEDVMRLLDQGADIEALDEYGDTALIRAVQKDNLEIARELLKRGAKMSYSYQREDTPEERDRIRSEWSTLDGLRQEGMEEFVSTFPNMPEGLKAELSSDETMQSVNSAMVDLHFELTNNNVIEDCCSLLMLKMLVTEFGADIDYVSGEGLWPLKSFVEMKNTMAVEWLLENGANPNQTSTGDTAIYVAIRDDDQEMVKLLLKYGAILDIIDVDGCGPVGSCESVSMAKVLIESGADLLVRDLADFPSWYFINDLETKSYIEVEARKLADK